MPAFPEHDNVKKDVLNVLSRTLLNLPSNLVNLAE